MFTLVTTLDEVEQMLQLQKENLSSNLSAEETQSQGFVTIQHDFEVLRAMNQHSPSVIAKDGDKVVGFCMMMPQSFTSEIPEMVGLMGDSADNTWLGQTILGNPRWFYIGQICVAASHRGQGIFDGLYQHLRTSYRDRYDFVVTAISTRNTRSQRAHQRVGFEVLVTRTDPATGSSWDIVVWTF